MISFVKKTWKDRSAGAAQGIDPALSATEMQRHEDAIDALVKQAYDTVYDQTLLANADAITISGLVLTGLLAIKVIASLKGSGAHSPHWVHTYMELNGDTTPGNYAWSVRNSDDTGVVSIQGVEPHIIIGHAPAGDAAEANEFGTHEIDIYLPGDTNNVKNISMTNQVMTNFASYSDLNPIEMRGGGFWKGPGAITQIKLLPEFNQFAAGSRVVIKAIKA